nr:lipid A deacylase LpxR family protein [Marinimicrobium alkaliphilum]
MIWHNDLFVGKDGGGYTNGAFVAWYRLSALDDTPEFKRPPLLRGWSPLLLPARDNVRFEVNAHALGQVMSTPQNISATTPEVNDAPYAGLLFLRSAYFAVYDDYADILGLNVGIIGPASGAEHTQAFIHKITGSTDPQGWDYQLRNEPVFNIERGRIWRLASSPREPSFDLLAMAGVSAGNFESAAGGGFILRFGAGLQDSFPTAAQMTGRISNPMAINGGWNVYLGVSSEYVHNQILVEGNYLRSSASADLEHWQYQFSAGFSYSWDAFSATLSLSDGNTMDRRATARQRFGSLTFAWRL